mmetsp:Transcript_55376/g.160780  ORF Transcript_55376/g.160780 Transcript_55376/m.160780 type:complete len:216 (+) Transcript_55376:105-752(+)
MLGPWSGRAVGAMLALAAAALPADAMRHERTTWPAWLWPFTHFAHYMGYNESSGTDRVAGEGRLYDPRKVRQAVRRAAGLPVPRELAERAVDYLVDPGETVDRTWDAVCPDFAPFIDRWRLRVYRDGSAVFCNVTTWSRGQHGATDVIRLRPVYNEMGFAGYDGRGQASFARMPVDDAHYSFRFHEDRLDGVVRYILGRTKCRQSIPSCGYPWCL